MAPNSSGHQPAVELLLSRGAYRLAHDLRPEGQPSPFKGAHASGYPDIARLIELAMFHEVFVMMARHEVEGKRADPPLPPEPRGEEIRKEPEASLLLPPLSTRQLPPPVLQLLLILLRTRRRAPRRRMALISP